LYTNSTGTILSCTQTYKNEDYINQCYQSEVTISVEASYRGSEVGDNIHAVSSCLKSVLLLTQTGSLGIVGEKIVLNIIKFL